MGRVAPCAAGVPGCYLTGASRGAGQAVRRRSLRGKSVVEGLTRDSSDSPERPAGRNERFATIVEGDRARILASYEQSLVESKNPIMGEPHVANKFWRAVQK